MADIICSEKRTVFFFENVARRELSALSRLTMRMRSGRKDIAFQLYDFKKGDPMGNFYK